MVYFKKLVKSTSNKVIKIFFKKAFNQRTLFTIGKALTNSNTRHNNTNISILENILISVE